MSMEITWNDQEPIFRQLYNWFIELLLEGNFKEGDALPSIRETSRQYRINHITVAKALQMLVDDGLIEKRRGLGMYVLPGALKKLERIERQKFLENEWPSICAKADRLGLSVESLLKTVPKRKTS